jgi:diguanylate cyclase (GGDEF)-like protein
MHLAVAGLPGATCQHYAHGHSGAHLCVPLVAQEGAFGLLHVSRASVDSQASGSEAWQHLAQAMSETVSLALANLNLRESLRNQSIRDPLTGLFNRRYMQESLERELLRATRSSYAIGIIMLDIDHFKNFNDTFGHAAGDQMLRELGSFLKLQVRGGDIVCRYGGEEFTIILPEASLAIARQRAELLHREARQLQVQYQGQPLGPITLSLGVAAFPQHGTAADALLQVADEALYRAKNAGRDRVVSAG